MIPNSSRQPALFSRRQLLALGAAALPVQAQPAHPRAPVLVLNSLDGTVSVINATSWTETRRIATGKEPHHLYLTPDEKSVIVANAGGDSLTFIDPRTAEVQRTLRGILDPYHLRFSPDMKWFVTAANRLNHVDLYHWDGRDPELAKRIPTGRTPSHQRPNPTGTATSTICRSPPTKKKRPKRGRSSSENSKPMVNSSRNTPTSANCSS